MSEMEEVKRPHTGDFETLREYKQAWRDYAKFRHKTGQHTPKHYDNGYPLVRECEKCGGIAAICLLSSPEDPMWQCKRGVHENYSDYYTSE